MFLGEYKASCTQGKRVAIPGKLRKKISGDTVIATRGYENSIVIVTPEHFETLLEGVTDQPFISADKREATRFLLGGAHELNVDSQGRIVIPESLIEHAHIASDDVVFVGLGNWIELWDEHQWEQYRAQMARESVEIANRLVNVND
ncbi:division/cell wall cluster transcriptional repressor MraZ [bacterium]|uniref:Transcriptional regulator MraZ n=1 Tax=candidate division WWE3 bacterium CG22_combo_CG10-13_8_21_14_all_39_12 TaxID=1975094 RepID=A0A2H0BHB3_UNCKA|nr:division/cell wall cluster transcriptional repressor MraZ [bacterium]PIP56400.1 MAG: division/cell wall cluster transcriptional repressor MraZ [candidate division WWE3 bacterium CG22_combo_CG10-13_8_21_14_all_39_12]